MTRILLLHNYYSMKTNSVGHGTNITTTTKIKDKHTISNKENLILPEQNYHVRILQLMKYN